MQEEAAKESFAESLRELMEDEGLTVTAFAGSVACDVAAVRRWLYGEHFADALVLVRIVPAISHFCRLSVRAFG